MAIRLAINMINHHEDCNKGGEGIAGALLGHGSGLPSAGSTSAGSTLGRFADRHPSATRPPKNRPIGSRADTATAVGTTDPRRPSNEVPDLRGLPPPSEAAAFPRPQNSMARRANGTPDDASAGIRRGKAGQGDDGRDLRR